MRFIRFVSKGFGCLPDGFEWHFNPEGLSLLLGNNEMGKSTLVRGLLAGLYGEPQGSREAKAFRERLSPWSGDKKGPGLLLDILAKDGKQLTIHRDFGLKAVQVTETLSRLERTSEFQVSGKIFAIGESAKFTKLCRATFEKTALLQQNDLKDFKSSDDLVTAIEKVIDSGESGMTAEEARMLLKAAESQTDPVRGGDPIKLSNVLARLSSAIEELLQEKNLLENDYDAYQGQFKALEELLEKAGQSKTQIQQQEIRVIQAEYLTNERAIQKQQALQEELEAVQVRIKALSSYQAFPIHSREDIQSLYGQFILMNESLAKKQETLSALGQDLSVQERVLSTFQWDPNNFSQPEDISYRLQQLEELKQQYRQAKESFEKERERLEGQNQDCSRFHRLFSRFRSFPPDKALAIYQFIEQQKRHDIPKSRSWIFLSAILALGLLLSCLLLTHPLLGFALGVSGATWLALIIAKYVRWKRDEKLFSAQQASLIQQLEKWQADTKAILPQMPKLEILQDLAWLHEKKQALFSSYVSLWQAVEQREQDLESTLLLLKTMLNIGWDESESLTRRLDSMIPVLESYKAFKTHCQTRQSLQEELDSVKKSCTTDRETCLGIEQHIRELFTSAGIPEIESVEEGMALYQQGIDRYSEFKNLESQLQEKQQHLYSEEEINRLRSYLRDFAETFHSVELPEHLGSEFEERQKLKHFEEEQNRLKEEINQLRFSIFEKQEHYNRRYPELQRELDEKRVLLQRYQDYTEALAMAQDVLQAISQDTYTQWSQRLNQRVNRYLKGFRSPYGDIRFTPDLRFSFMDSNQREHSQVGSLQQLSQGARDQVYLAVRLAITDYLSQESGHLPLILDDPFVNLDDERFLYALEALVEAGATGQQILLFSCHMQRYRQAFDRLSPSYPSHFFLQPFGISHPSPKHHALIQ